MCVTIRKEDCEAAVRSLINTPKFFLKDYKAKPFSDKIVGFMGRHFKLNVSVIFEGKVHEFQLFAKLAPTDGSHRNFVIEQNLFSKEIAMYNDLVPLLTASLPQGVTFPVPKCLFARETKTRGVTPAPGSADEELIILEDVTQRGYCLLEDFPALDLPHCRVVLRTMARFHAASLLLEHSHKSNSITDPSEDLFAIAKENVLVHEKDHVGYKWTESSSETTATAAMKMWPQHFAGKRDKLLETLKVGWKMALDMAQTSRKYQNVLCHGDMWTNNVMFMYDLQPGGGRLPVDALFVDLQIVRYAPPAIDILLFINICTRKALRDLHLYQLLKYYHSCLEEIMSPDLLEKMLPFASLLESYEELKRFGIMMSTGYIPMLVPQNTAEIPPENKTNEPLDIDALILQDKGEKIAMNCERSRTCRERIGETFEECLKELGVWKNEIN